ncbi:hypothetical protein [Azospirillum sp. sgz302134]
MKTKHTPGPWWIDPKAPGGGNIQSAKGPVADARFFGNTSAEAMADHANARLIAAAPELLEALKGLVEVLTTDGGLEPCSLSMAPAERYFGLAVEAIAKAAAPAREAVVI